MSLNRIVAVLTAIAGIAGAIAVPLGNLDTHSTSGVVAGLGAITAAAVTWLLGWQKHEARQADDPGEAAAARLADPAIDDPAPVDQTAANPTDHHHLAAGPEDVAERDAREGMTPGVA